jgi:PAS domain-containing protein
MMLDELDLLKIEQAEDFISGFDKEMKITVWNNAIATKYKISREQALGKILFHFFPGLENDFRIKCFQETLKEGKSFYFSKLPYSFESGFYTQLILPLHDRSDIHALSIVRHHRTEEQFLKKDLLHPLLK